MSDDTVQLEIDGEACSARRGQMLIEVTDAAGIYVPRFCYHRKLSIAANCRMCLVEVEKAPKPLPACATPVMDGMKVHTRSPKAISAQKATMEFLLINHPLDCPICDQGGECELQDLAMGYGRDVSRFVEKKRVVKDKDLGPLVSTDMTRCIHCTRCVRFGQEIAGIQELGTLGRGEHMQIGTYVERAVDHELSGNIIDLCPVGALNNKPYRYTARSWEMTEHAAVGAHDCVGSNLYAHVYNGIVKRVVPRPNDAINETWLSDRDRFSYEGIYAADRLERPRIKVDGTWQDCSWEAAFAAAAKSLKSLTADHGPETLGGLISPNATSEEHYLFARLLRGLGCANIDHRLRRRDFRDQDGDPAVPGLGMPIPALEQQDALLVIGADLRREAPLIAHRVRKAALAGARVAFLDTQRFEYLFPVASQYTIAQAELVPALAGVAVAACRRAGRALPPQLASAAENMHIGPAEERLAALLTDAQEVTVMLGLRAQRHPLYSDLRALAAVACAATGARLSLLTEGCNSAGAAIAGSLPHRGPLGTPVRESGLDAMAMTRAPRRGYVLFGIEPEADCAGAGEMLTAFDGAGVVVAVTPYCTPTMEAYADVLLPLGSFAETDGSFVNVAGQWQSYRAFAKPVGEARPGWKILRVLGNLLGLDGFDFVSAEEVTAELTGRGQIPPTTGSYEGSYAVTSPSAVEEVLLGVPAYATDMVVRRAEALQQTLEARQTLTKPQAVDAA